MSQKSGTKRKASSLAAQKKAGVNPASHNPLSKKSSSDVEVVENIQSFKKGILASKENLNDILKLYKYTESKKAEVVYNAVKALQFVFVSLIKRGDIQLYKPISDNGSLDAAQVQVSEWLGTILKKWYRHLFTLLNSRDPAIQVAALDAFFALIREDSAAGVEAQKGYTFNSAYMEEFGEALVASKHLADETINYLVEKYLNCFEDIRYYTLKMLAISVTKLITQNNAEQVKHVVEWVFKLLSSIRSMPTKDEDIKKFWATHPGKIESKGTHFLLMTSTHRREFQEAWLSFFRLKLSNTILKRVLLALHQRVLPHMLNPVALLDFLVHCYDQGGVIALLALNGLFTLIHKHNMDYPDFYTKLYQCFTPDLLHVKHRSRFFRLTELFLSSAYLPAGLIAAFVKRMARLALHGPPGALVLILPFIYNLLRAHPACMILIHRAGEIKCGERDPYDFSQSNPTLSNALESSLWEVEALSRHYSANVSSLAKLFSDQFTKPSYLLEDFMDHNFNSMISAELGKPFKKVPALAIKLSPTLLPSSDSNSEDSKLFSLCDEWVF
ncbi:Maturation and nuclear export of 40S ribosomal subunits interacting protein [Entomophthora muscae]|uniref:Maturation and nuclear export of 40S ribosomal subunits interacting protein n=2 Tax=Entomophthora muscae TaxID=34485 RepID=A0ACC2TQK2_9FUNG|nr:Maturation and nuclear export of 40S ribosomal subunits interacting protein [Entomophthora muscae]